MTKTLKTLFFFIFYRPQGSLREKSRASGPGPGAEGIVRVGKLKLTFHCFYLCVWVCVRSISGGMKQYRRLFFYEKVWVSRFFLLMQYKSGSLYFLHKLLNETAYLRSMKSPRVGIMAFFVCATVWNRSPSERERESLWTGSLFGEKNCKEREGKGGVGEREPVDKHLQIDLRPLFRPLVIILPNICQ